MLARFILLCVSLLSLPALAEPAEFRVLTYNVFLRAPTWMFHNEHTWRTERIPPYLAGYDAVVLQEAFSNKHRAMILDALREEYPYSSSILGEDEFLSYNGGVIILSRWPIAREAQQVFDVCDGSDCMVKKGVVYAEIDKPGLTVNLFGLHLQAEKKYSEARVQQFPQLLAFITQQDISAREPVVVAGDFNVDYHSDALDREYTALIELVGLAHAGDDFAATYEDDSNSIIDDPVSERLDYIFHATSYLAPVTAYSEIKFFRMGEKDLSDHHPLAARFTFEASP